MGMERRGGVRENERQRLPFALITGGIYCLSSGAGQAAVDMDIKMPENIHKRRKPYKKHYCKSVFLKLKNRKRGESTSIFNSYFNSIMESVTRISFSRQAEGQWVKPPGP